MTRQQRGLLIALIGTIAWASTAIFIRHLLNDYPLQPLTLAFWRDLIISTTLLVSLLIWQPRALRISRGDLPFLILYGFLGLAVFNSLWTYSVKFNGAAVATVLVYCAPVFTVALARVFLHEPITPRRVLAVGLSLTGCVLVARAYTAEAWQVNPLGIVVGLAAGLGFTVISLLGRSAARRFANSWTLTAYGFLFAALALGMTQTADSLFTLQTAPNPWTGWALLAALAIGPSIAGYGLYNVSLRYLEAGVAGLVASLEPVFTALMAFFILGEWLDPLQWAGTGLVLLAVVLVQQQYQTAAAA